MNSISIKHHCGKWLAIALITMAWLSSTNLQAQVTRKSVGEVADTFELINIRTGEPFSLSEAEGSIVLLDFFFYW